MTVTIERMPFSIIKVIICMLMLDEMHREKIRWGEKSHSLQLWNSSIILELPPPNPLVAVSLFPESWEGWGLCGSSTGITGGQNTATSREGRHWLGTAAKQLTETCYWPSWHTIDLNSTMCALSVYLFIHLPMHWSTDRIFYFVWGSCSGHVAMLVVKPA